MTDTNTDDMAEVILRADELSRKGVRIGRAAQYLNAEFFSCFYAVRNTLYMSFTAGGREEIRTIGAFPA